jgi:uncharacterized repeat protein (TIGR01451 family)
MKRKIGLLIVLVVALALPIAVFASGHFYEYFDTYTAGDPLDGVNGWKGWGGTPAVAGIVTDTVAVSGDNSVVIGSGGVDTDAVREFSHTSGQWVMTAWQYVPSTQTGGGSYFIMLNQYDDPGATNNWSVQVQHDAVAGLVIDDASGAILPLITDQWVEIRVEIDLDADTQSYYYDGTLLYTGVWNGYQSGPGTGSDAIAALDLYANNTTNVYYDNISLVPAGAVGPDLSVSKTPDTQTIVTGGNADFTITVTNTGDITLTQVMAVDPLAPTCNYTMTNLAPGASGSYSCTDVGVSAGYTNVVTTTGYVAFGPSATASDSAAVVTRNPTGVSLSSFDGSSTTSAALWFAALVLLAVVAASAVAVVGRQRSRA